MRRLILIRHCETDSNASGVVQGRSDLPLSSRGIRQTNLLAAHLKREYSSIDRVVSSDRARCTATAEAIEIPAHSTTLLRELDFGEWEGQKWSDIQAKKPEDFSRLMNSDPGFAPPGGETIDHLNNRLEQAIEEYDLISSQNTIAVVAHDGILRSMIASILGWPAVNMVNMILFNGSVSEISIEAGIPRLALLNFYDHMTPSYEESNMN